MSTRCSMCGTPVGENEKFCPHCGAPIQSGYSYGAQGTSSDTKSERKTVRTGSPDRPTVNIPASGTHGGRGNDKRLWLWIGLAVVVVAAVVVTVFLINRHNREIEAELARERQQKELALERQRAMEEEQQRQQDSIADLELRRDEILNAYLGIIDAKKGSLYYDQDGYTLKDLTGDGLPEIIIHTGTCEADRMYEIYDVSSGTARKLGEVNAGHSGLAVGSDYLLVCMMHMGYESRVKVTFNGSKINEKEVYTHESYNYETEEYDEGDPVKEPFANWYPANQTDVLRNYVNNYVP